MLQVGADVVDIVAAVHRDQGEGGAQRGGGDARPDGGAGLALRKQEQDDRARGGTQQRKDQRAVSRNGRKIKNTK